ncbi:MAG: TonB-dependent receptor, partial [Actinomycetota bacterium]
MKSTSAVIDTDLRIATGPAAVFYVRDDLRDGEDITQDLRLEIKNEGTGLSGVVGGFYGNYEAHTDTSISANVGGILFGIPDPFLTPIQLGESENQTKSRALYADLRYAFNPTWSLIGGLRYQQDEVQNFINVFSIDTTTFSPILN